MPRTIDLFSRKNEKTIVIDGIGEVTLKRSRQARRIILSVRPDGIVRLSVPWNSSYHDAVRFASTKTEWVAKVRGKYEARKPETTVKLPFRTRMHEIITVSVPDTKDYAPSTVSSTVRNGKITVLYPSHLSFENPKVQSVAKKAIEEAWRKEAKLLLPGRIAILAGKTGLRYGKITIRNTVSKWGSCSTRNDISLSLHLMRLPDHLIDYILLHELCHTVHKNHGKEFHALLDRLCGGNSALYKKELKNFTTRW